VGNKKGDISLPV